MALNEDEGVAGGLMNAARDAVGEETVRAVIAEMPARDANDAQRALEIGKQMRQGR